MFLSDPLCLAQRVFFLGGVAGEVHARIRA